MQICFKLFIFGSTDNKTKILNTVITTIRLFNEITTIKIYRRSTEQ
jgi:hypothetical protein